ncbi:MAG TPA: apolipoprotein N-acyltransferase [Propionibacteriaceae bacterium]|nr:apolipoprotein N-acyltransferase [Propionibacteriaceae bacterium]
MAEAVGLAGPTTRRQLALRVTVALLAGLAIGLSWQPYNLWPLLLIGLPAFTLVVRHAPLRRAFGLGYLFGLAMLSVAISWIHVLGAPVAVALIAFEALFFGILGVTLSLTSTLRAWPLAAACCWALVEFAFARIPFGGFGWTRIGFAVVDTPLAGFFPVVGVVGVSFLVALIGQLVAWAALLAYAARRRAPSPAADRLAARTRRSLVIVVALTVLLVLGGVGLTRFQVEPVAGRAGSVTVGIVQGNVPGRGIEAMGRARSVTDNHLAETVNLLTRSRLGLTPRPDFLLWPENSTDIDPLRDYLTGQVVQSATEVAGMPILVGAVTEGPGPQERQTSALWWDPQRGVLARYDKRNLVPFGEWIPFRRQLLPVVPILAKVGAQSVPGTEPGVLTVPLGQREVKVGDVICFELAYDATVYETMTRGAQVLMVQSNNATYGGTGQIEQQFAITRARAMETRREIAVATTNSVSGHIDRDGRVVSRTQEFTAASLAVALPLRSALTPAVLLAPWLGRALAVAGLLCCLVALAARRSRSSLQTPPMGEDGSMQSDKAFALTADTGRSRS